MCRVSASDLVVTLRATTARLLDGLGPDAAELADVLRSGCPLVEPATDPVPRPLTYTELLATKPADYPQLLAALLGPPVSVGHDEELAYLAAECAVAAWRAGEVQGTLAMLFLVSLCTPDLSPVAAEVVHHLLIGFGTDGRPGLLAAAIAKSGMDDAEVAEQRDRMTTVFATTATQLVGRWSGTD